MRQYATLSQFGQPYFKKGFVVSVIFHGVLLSLAFILPRMSIFKGKQAHSLYSAAVRVDLVDLPETLLRDLHKNMLTTEDAIRSLRRKMQSLTLLKRQSGAKAAIEKLKALRQNQEKQQVAKQKTSFSGNIQSEGVSTPETQSGAKPLDAYRGLLLEKVKLRWALPSYLRKQDHLSGEVILFLNADGSVFRMQIVSSGNRDFDEYMNRTLQETFPFPDVPKEAQKDLRYDGLSITFMAGELK